MADLAHLIFDSWNRVILKLIGKLFPFERVGILLLDKLEIAFREAKISQIDIPSIPSPYVTSDLCPVRPELSEVSLSFEEQRSEDLSLCLKEELSRTQIEDLDFQLDRTEPPLDKLEIAFREAKISQIDIPSIPSPYVTFNVCPGRPELIEVSLSFEEQKSENLSTCLKEGMSCLQIEDLDFRFNRTQISELNIFFESERIVDLTTWVKEEQRRSEEHHKAEVLREEVEEEHPGSEQEGERVEKEIRPKTEKAKQTSEEGEHLTAEAESKWVDPVNRGGKPRTSTQAGEKQAVQETKSRRLKPEIVCWKRERQWIIAVEVPEDLLENSGLVVLQNASSLTQDESSEGCWHLEQAYGQVMVHWNEDEVVRETEIALGEENSLLFKLSGQNQNWGRRVKSPSSGSYLVVVAENRERDYSLSGPPPVAPESVSMDGYRGHFFILEEDSDRKIAFRTLEGKLVLIEPEAPRFELVGTRLNDASEDKGPLFGERPPQICTLDNQAWKDVRTIVVGEEGTGKRRWRTQFSPIPEVVEQELPSEVMARKGGWYFLRFYDTNYDLLESLDFRFMCILRGIKIPKSSPLPSKGGHKPVCVEFLHEPSCTVEQADGLACDIQIEHKGDKTILTIPPDPIYDETRCVVRPKDGPQEQVTILVERLWWALGEEAKTPTEWKDTRFTLSRDDLAATSSKAIWLRLPRPRWISTVHVGFKEITARPYNVNVVERTVAIPLRDFGDAQEVQASVGVIPINLWTYSQETIYTATLCELSVKLHCKFRDFITLNKEEMLSHLASSHLDYFFRLLSYEELREHFPSLPIKIYKCSHCDFYVASDDPRNPNSTICRHIERDCKKVPKSGVKDRFSIIDNADEIRENVFKNLPRILRCNLCDAPFKDAIMTDMRRHLLKTHGSSLLTYNEEGADA